MIYFKKPQRFSPSLAVKRRDVNLPINVEANFYSGNTHTEVLRNAELREDLILNK